MLALHRMHIMLVDLACVLSEMLVELGNVFRVGQLGFKGSSYLIALFLSDCCFVLCFCFTPSVSYIYNSHKNGASSCTDSRP